MSVEADICFNPFWKENVKIHESELVSILEYAVKDNDCTCGVKLKIESEGILNPGNAGKRHNMHVGSNICRYVICQDTVSEGSLRMCRQCGGEV